MEIGKKLLMHKLIGDVVLVSISLFIFDNDLFAQQIHESIRLETFYSNIDKLLCGNKSIVITSSCVANDATNSDPYCFSQSVAFVQNKKRQAKIFTYSYEADKQQFIYEASCFEYKGKPYVKLINSNLGNCEVCEWVDYFDANGFYFASSRGMPNKTSFKKIGVTNDMRKKFTRAVEIQKINLTTIAH